MTKKKRNNFMERKQLIVNTISDLCMDFLYYDRKEDDELTQNDLIEAVKNKEITIDQMVNVFRIQLESHFV